MQRTSSEKETQASVRSRKEQREYLYRLRLQIGLVCALLFLIAAFQSKLRYQPDLAVQASIGNPIVLVDLPPPTREKPIKPRTPAVPVLAKDDIVLEDMPAFDAALDLDTEQVIEEPPTVEEKVHEEEGAFVFVEEMPEIDGGMSALMKEIKYPQMAKKAGIEGRVIIQFVVTPEGEVADAVVVRSVGGGCDEEALRALSEMKFSPGRQRGQPVAVRMTIPIMFKLR